MRISRRSRGSSIDRRKPRKAVRPRAAGHRPGGPAGPPGALGGRGVRPSSRSVPRAARGARGRARQPPGQAKRPRPGPLPGRVSPLHEIVPFPSGRQGADERAPSDRRRIAAHGGGARGDRAGRGLRPHADVSPAEGDVEGDAGAPDGEEGRSGGDRGSRGARGARRPGGVDRVRRQRAHADPADPGKFTKGGRQST